MAVVDEHMVRVFADAWWGEHTRRRRLALPDDNEACDRVALQVVLDVCVPQQGAVAARSPNPLPLRPAVPPGVDGA